MKKICSYCRAHYGDTPDPPPAGLPPDAVTHGICDKCLPAINAELDARIEKRKIEKLKREKGE